MNTINVQMSDVAFEVTNAILPQDKFGINNAQPAIFMIEKMWAWHEEGFKIVIETTRDVELEREVTEEWLNHYEVPYDELVWIQ